MVKILHDGTEVSDDTPTKMTSEGRFLLSQEEVGQLEQDRYSQIKPRLHNFINQYRKEVGDGPATFQGITIYGDSKTRTAIAETVQFWQELDPEDAPDTIDWEGPEGFHQISLSTLIGLGKAIGFQRQKSFSVKKAVVAKIEAGQITTIEDAKAAFDAGMAA